MQLGDLASDNSATANIRTAATILASLARLSSTFSEVEALEVPPVCTPDLHRPSALSYNVKSAEAMTGVRGLKAHSPACRSSSGLAWNAEGLDAHHQGNAYVPGPAQVPNSTAPPPASSEGMVLRGGSLAEPELQAARDSARSFEVCRYASCAFGVARLCWEGLPALCICTILHQTARTKDLLGLESLRVLYYLP